MLNMSKKNGVGPPRGGTASAVREAARSGVPESPTTLAAPKRRSFTAEYKLRILNETDAALESGEPGALGEIIRREGLYGSHLITWRGQREAGQLAGLTKKRGPKSSKNELADENARLLRQVEKLQHELYKANTIIDVQKKVASLLGETLAEPTMEDFARGPDTSKPRRR